MPTALPRQDVAIRLKFGGGVHSRPAEDEIDDRECADGQNFLLDLENREFRTRPAFDLVGTVPNEARINGFATLLKGGGDASMLVQAGDAVYKWDGLGGFDVVGTVSSSARLRGRLEANYLLEDVVLITDLSLVEGVHVWDGSTFSAVEFVDQNTAPFGIFAAKYCFVTRERALFANVRDASGNLPHLLVGSEVSSYRTISVGQRPSSAIGNTAPFFLPSPDLRPFNGLTESFGVLALSTERGTIFKLVGTNAENFGVEGLYHFSGATGEEGVAYVGNDVVFGRQGRIEALSATDRFGDVETDDLTLPISDTAESVPSWTTVYNRRLQRVYCFPTGRSECWVMQKALVGSGLSPWTKWVTLHPMAMQPTAVLNCIDPVDGLEYVFFGDSNGNVYRMEGTGTTDGGTFDVEAEWQSKMYSAPLDATASYIDGWLKFRKNTAASVELTAEWSGSSVFDRTITMPLEGVSGFPVYGDASYYGGSVYYGVPFSGRFVRKPFSISGEGNDIQIRLRATGGPVEINEVGLRFSSAG